MSADRETAATPSNPAATIRDARERAQSWIADEGDTGMVSGRSMRMADAAVVVCALADALLVERQQLRYALREAITFLSLGTEDDKLAAAQLEAMLAAAAAAVQEETRP